MALSRRRLLVALPAASIGFGQSGGKGRVFPSEMKRYADPATEFPVIRITNPAHTSILPGPLARGISKHGFLVYASDVSGKFEAYRVDLKSGQQKQLTEAKSLDPHSLTLMPDDRSIAYFDGPSLVVASLAALHTREVFRAPENFSFGRGLAVADDGLFFAAVLRSKEHFQLRLIS